MPTPLLFFIAVNVPKIAIAAKGTKINSKNNIPNAASTHVKLNALVLVQGLA